MMDQQAPNGADFMVQPGGGQGDAVQNENAQHVSTDCMTSDEAMCLTML